MTMTSAATMTEYDFIPGSVTDTCGVCLTTFDLQRPADQYTTVRNWGTDTFVLVCDDCEDAPIPAPTEETRVMPNPIDGPAPVLRPGPRCASRGHNVGPDNGVWA